MPDGASQQGASSAAGTRIIAVGDLQLGDSPTAVGFGFHSRYQARPLTQVFEHVRQQLSGADLLFGNLECTISRHGLQPSNWRSTQLRGEPAFAAALREVGFDVLNVANNHAVQHGIETFRETIAAVRAAGIAVCGVKGSDGWLTEPVRITARNGARIGILGYCRRPRQYSLAEPPYAEGEAPEICADIERLKPTVDHVLVSMHWGEEFVPQPSKAEVELGHAIIEAGAKVLLGTHPHVVRPFEPVGTSLIAYSLGNFVADMVWYEPLRHGAILDCRLTEGGVTTELYSTYIDDDYRPRVDGRLELLKTGTPLGLAENVYAERIAETIGAQRRGVYAHAAKNVFRFPPRVVGQLVGSTVLNKLAGAVGIVRRPPPA